MNIPSSIANPTLAKLLEETLPQVLPERRLKVAAEILGCKIFDILQAAGVPKYKAYKSMGSEANVNQHIVPLAKVLGMSVEALWDDQALENPKSVICCLEVVNRGPKRKPAFLKAAS